MYAYLLTIAIALAGFFLALYMFQKKRNKVEHFVCPLRGNCTDVIGSRYSHFLGIPVEILGLVYYSFIVLGYTAIVSFPVLMDQSIVKIIALFASTFAVTFSFYLTFIQFAFLKKLCTWCLVSAFFCFSLFLLSLTISSSVILPVLVQAREGIVLLHMMSLGFGLSYMLFAIIFFHKFLKDLHISEDESLILDLFSQMTWFCIGIIAVTGLGIYLPDQGSVIALEKSFLQIIIFAVILFSNGYINLVATPHYIDLTFQTNLNEISHVLARVRRLVFILGPVMLLSWFSVFLLNMLSLSSFSFQNGLVYYVFFVSFAAYLGFVFERRTINNSSPRTE